MKVRLVAFFLVLIGFTSSAQTLPVGFFDSVEEMYRREQLLGNDSSGSSYMIRPLHVSFFRNFDLDKADFSLSGLRKQLYINKSGKIRIDAMPVVLQQQYNTKQPYGMNDNSMVQARGYQSMLSAGIFAKIGPLSIQLRPEYVYAENKSFNGPETVQGDDVFQSTYARLVYNVIDNPSTMGRGQYNKLSWGQSSIRLNFDPVSFGLSNENLWWGPGVRNSLLMSNNASGFKHLTLNTTRPVNVHIGHIEAQIISGKLESSGVGIPENIPAAYVSKYKTKPDDWRYLSGLVFTYQPKWVPNLYLGVNRTFIVYRKDMGSSFSDYFPFFDGVNKLNGYDRETNIDEEDTRKRDQYFSLFGRWVLPESKAEVYFEYGRNDHSVNTRDYFLEAEHSRAYIAGFRKLIGLARPDEYIQVGLEFTQLESPKTSNVRLGPVWYQHHQVVAGYTNRGQVLGAGIGPGSNLQSFDVNWVKGLKKIGLTLERLVHNGDYFYNAKATISDVRRHWVDFVVGGNFNWDFNHLVLTSNLTYIRSLNNQWRFKDDGSFFWDVPKTDVNNVHMKVGLMYRW